MGQRIALLIGVSEYAAGLNPLPAAVRDVAAVQEVLARSDLGNFHVEVLENPGLLEMRQRIAWLFRYRAPDDLLVLYFSGHGKVDERGQFYFTTNQTDCSQGFDKATAVDAAFVHDAMETGYSERQVLILDCCQSGAFPTGMVARDTGEIDFQAQLGGKGRIVLASSGAAEYSFEREGEELAIYTRYLVQGIRTGAADRDEDGWISVDELHDYVRAEVKKEAPSMNPERYVFQDGEKILLAQAVVADPRQAYRKLVENIVRMVIFALQDGRFCGVIGYV